jgi:hypothetical protein
MEISFTQKNKCDKDWTHYWFYVKNTSMSSKTGRGPKVVCYSLASTMKDMKPSTCIMPGTDLAREAAFALAYHYSRGRDLM